MTIDRSSIEKVLFSKQDVLETSAEQGLRKTQLRRALLVGNVYSRSAKIKFRTIEGYVREIEERVWAVGEEYISFVSGVHMPVCAIESVSVE